jgi:hypothetical protein
MAEIRIHILSEEFPREYLEAFFPHNHVEKVEFEKKHNVDLFLLCRDTPSVFVYDTGSPLRTEGYLHFVELFPYRKSMEIDATLLDAAVTEAFLGNIPTQVFYFLRQHRGCQAFCVAW